MCCVHVCSTVCTVHVVVYAHVLCLYAHVCVEMFLWYMYAFIFVVNVLHMCIVSVC